MNGESAVRMDLFVSLLIYAYWSSFYLQGFRVTGGFCCYISVPILNFALGACILFFFYTIHCLFVE